MFKTKVVALVCAGCLSLAIAAPTQAISLLRIKNFLDANGDNSLSYSEMKSRVSLLYKRGDANGNGQVTWAEAEAALKKAGRSYGMSSSRINKIVYGKMKPRFKRADSNGNGALSKSELLNAVSIRFRKYDRNKNGKVSYLEALRG